MIKKFIKIVEMEKSELENMEIVTGFTGSHNLAKQIVHLTQGQIHDIFGPIGAPVGGADIDISRGYGYYSDSFVAGTKG